ncbi:hypothetical protein BH11BAC2_BH11BAC2_20350 [soil metagenome]
MKTEIKDTVKTFAVPADMLMDILQIVLKSELPNRNKGINIKENVLWLSVKFPADNPNSKGAKENIETHLNDYGLYANGAPEDAEFGNYSSEDDF